MTKVIEYRGIKAIYFFIEKDDKYFGRAIDNKDLPKFEGKTKENIELNFQKVVNKYLLNKNS